MCACAVRHTYEKENTGGDTPRLKNMEECRVEEGVLILIEVQQINLAPLVQYHFTQSKAEEVGVGQRCKYMSVRTAIR